MHKFLCEVLLGSKPANIGELAYIKGLEENTIYALIRGSDAPHPFLDKLASCVWTAVQALKAAAAATPDELHDKFKLDSKFTLEFSGLETFYDGLSGLVGLPEVPISNSMHREHCESADSLVEFITSNYKISTTPRIEWYFVVDPFGPNGIDTYPAEDPATLSPERHRRPVPPAQFKAERDGINAKLEAVDTGSLVDEEFHGARLCIHSRDLNWGLHHALTLHASLSSPKCEFLRGQTQDHVL